MIKVEPTLLRVAPATCSSLPAATPVVVGAVVAVEAVRDSATAQMLLLFAGRRWALKPGGAAADLVGRGGGGKDYRLGAAEGGNRRPRPRRCPTV